MNNKHYDELGRIELPSAWKINSAISECPKCDNEMLLQPFQGSVSSCSECGEILVVFIAPLNITGIDITFCSFQLRARDGSWRWLHTPGMFEFGEW